VAAVTDSGAEQAVDDAVAPDRVLKALAHADRRALLRELTALDADSVDATDLTTRLETVSAVELRHRHLPKLDDAGLLTFDSETGRVEYAPTDATEAVLDVIENHLE
jgi:DNA-binding transcriptional ArsR family regulator